MRVFAGAVLAAGMVAPGGSSSCADRVRGWFPDESGAVGIEVAPSARGLRVEAVWLDRPAFAVLETGDEILAADGISLEGLSFRQQIAAVRGPVGESVTLEVTRDGLSHTLTVDRAPLPWSHRGWLTSLTEQPFDGCGVKSPFTLEFDGDIQGEPVRFRLRGETPGGNALECVVDHLSEARWSAHGSYRLTVDADAVPDPVPGVHGCWSGE